MGSLSVEDIVAGGPRFGVRINQASARQVQRMLGSRLHNNVPVLDRKATHKWFQDHVWAHQSRPRGRLNSRGGSGRNRKGRNTAPSPRKQVVMLVEHMFE